jgi:hypothetical protein
MMLFDLLFGEDGPRLLLAAMIIAGVLTLLAAALEVALERGGGADPATLPDWFAEHGPAVFVFAGLPALILAAAGAFGLTLALGGNPDTSGLPAALPVLLDLCVLVAILGCGAGLPLTQHWGLAITAFGSGISLLFPLLLAAGRLSFSDDGGVPYPDRLVFALVIALLLIVTVVAAAALLALAISGLRTYRLLKQRATSSEQRGRHNRRQGMA